MRKKNIKFTCLFLCICIFLTACTKSTSPENNQNVEHEIEEEEMELITVERFMEIYDYTEEELGDFNLQAMILDLKITEADTENFDFRNAIDHYQELGMNFGYDIASVIYPKLRDITKEDDIRTMKWMVLEVGYNMETYIYIWDIENKKSYYANWNIMYDYSRADIKKDLTDEEVQSMIAGLEELGIHDWTEGFSIEDPTEIDYRWDLFIVLENDEVLYFCGIRPEAGNPEGFYEWLQTFTDISTSIPTN